MTTDVLFNGRPESAAWTAGRGLHYGDGVFRTCLIYRRQVIDITKQQNKLFDDASALNLSLRVARACMRDARSLAARHESGVLKILLWRGGEQRGYRPSSAAADRLLIRYTLPKWNKANWIAGVRAIRSPVTLAAQPRLAGIKHLSRLEQVLASAGWARGVSEAIQCDEDGHPICGTRANLFWISRGALYTPALKNCGVAGVMRDKVLELAETLRIKRRIGRWSWSSFENADEAFITNSLIGIWPLRAVGNRRWPAPGPVTHTLMIALKHPGIAGA